MNQSKLTLRVGIDTSKKMEKSNPMKNLNIGATLFTATLLFASLSTIENAEARKVGPVASGAAIETCLLSNDARLLENGTHFACCSKDAGICVICPKPPRANNSCNVISYRTNPILSPRAMSPDTLNGLGQMAK